MAKLGVGVLVFWVMFWGSWCANIYKLTQLDFETPYKAEAIRTFGLVPPVGAIVAWFDIEDK